MLSKILEALIAEYGFDAVSDELLSQAPDRPQPNDTCPPGYFYDQATGKCKKDIGS